MKISAEHITSPCEGHDQNGDAVVVRTCERGALIAVVDALGHGPRAAEIAARAVASLSEVPLDETIWATMDVLHESLRGTRGAAAMVSLIRDGQIEGCGVGNVTLRCLGANVPVVQSPGILGVRVRQYHVFSADLVPGARLVLFSDGISALAPVGDTQRMAARHACEFIFDGYRRSHDDATILVVDVKE